MTRTAARHRSDTPVSTPLDGIIDTAGSVLAEQASVAGRSGLAVAVTSGLVAGVGVGVPAASARTASQATTVTASVPLLASAQTLSSSRRVAAPAGAHVAFEHSALHAIAAAAAAARTPAGLARDVSQVSRAMARDVYLAELKARAQAARSQAVHAHAAHAAHAATVARRAAERRAAQRRAARAAALAAAARAAASRTTARSAPASSTTVTPSASASSRGAAVVALASRYLGVPYRYGGSSPRGFDCSGLTQYVYGLLGVRLPRTAAAQYGATAHVSRSQARAGDLVFFFTGGTVTHVGIYLGGNMMIAAPHTGDVVKKQSIYSSNVAFGRV